MQKIVYQKLTIIDVLFVDQSPDHFMGFTQCKIESNPHQDNPSDE